MDLRAPDTAVSHERSAEKKSVAAVPPRRLRRAYALEDFEPLAQRFLPRPVFGYVAGAAETLHSYDDNRQVFGEISFLPKVLRDVSGRTLTRTIMGRRYDLPFGIAPMGISALTAYRGDIVQARAAREANIPMIMSGSSLIALEDVVKAAPGTWFQAYLPGDLEGIEALVARVAAAGVETLVITVDSAVVPSRENNLRNNFKTPITPDLRLLWQGIRHPGWAFGTFLKTFAVHGVPHFENNFAQRGAPLLSRAAVRDFGGRERLTWAIVQQIRESWAGKLVLKGVLRVDDVREARALGADGVILSNHGGRQLDGAISPMRVLPRAAEIADGMALMIDSGFRRGTDILKAIGLGADFCFIGRPFNYAAALGGEAGVAYAIDLLRIQLRADLGMLGLESLDEMTRDMLFTEKFVPVPGA